MRPLACSHGHTLTDSTACAGTRADCRFAAESVDAVVIADALHHIGDVDAALSEAERVLRPGGVVVVREFDPATIRGRMLARGEHLLRMQSSFITPDALSEALYAANLVPRVRSRGFDYTIAGIKRTSGTT